MTSLPAAEPMITPTAGIDSLGPPLPTTIPSSNPRATEATPPLTGASMVFVPAGEFTMGATPSQQSVVLDFGWSFDLQQRISSLVAGAGPAHKVYLDDYYIDKHEVTNAEYRSFVEATGHRRPQSWTMDPFRRSNQPVAAVSWRDADAFCAWSGKRLPTEAEWEKAARGPKGYVYPWGNDWDPTKLMSAEWHAWHPLVDFEAWSQWQNESRSGTAEVGSFPPGASPYGAMDMAGNVWEWVADWYDSEYYSNSPLRNPTGPVRGSVRVLRGGAWDVPRVVAYTWIRETFVHPEFAGSMVTGFRCAASSDTNDADKPSQDRAALLLIENVD